MDVIAEIEVLESDVLVVVNFTTSWNPNCLQIAPKFEKLAKEMENIAVFVKIDVD